MPYTYSCDVTFYQRIKKEPLLCIVMTARHGIEIRRMSLLCIHGYLVRRLSGESVGIGSLEQRLDASLG